MFKIFKKKTKNQIVITFTGYETGLRSDIVLNKDVSVEQAIETLNYVRNSVVLNLKKHVEKARFNPHDRAGINKFIHSLTIGDIMKTQKIEL